MPRGAPAYEVLRELEQGPECYPDLNHAKIDASDKSQKTEIGALQNKDLRRKNGRLGTFVGRVKIHVTDRRFK